MDLNLSKRVILKKESENKTLYSWSIRELDDKGKQIGRDQIPWEFSLYFSARELTFRESLAIKSEYSSDTDEEIKAHENQEIIAEIIPEESQSEFGRSNILFSMFGTDRVITQFQLVIKKLSKDEEQDYCSVWGCPSYTSEVDFIDQTIDDLIIFTLYVRPKTFARYVEMLCTSQVSQVALRVGNVSGFYSEWSPSISTNNIKVLTSDSAHVVEFPEGWEITPPRLGTVGEVELCLNWTTKLNEGKDNTTN